MAKYESFNNSDFSKFLNSPQGRILRIGIGTGFLVTGFLYRGSALGVISMIWGALPLSAGILDICYVSAVLGGPISGKKIRNSVAVAESNV